MKSSIKNLKVNRWSIKRLLQLSESLDQAYGTDEIEKDKKEQGLGWRTQQLLDMSAAKAQPFV
jgi:hypothetical protein